MKLIVFKTDTGIQIRFAEIDAAGHFGRVAAVEHVVAAILEPGGPAATCGFYGSDTLSTRSERFKKFTRRYLKDTN